MFVGLTMGGTIAFYTYTTYMQKYLVNTAHMNAETATLVMTAVLFCFMLIQPLFGALSGESLLRADLDGLPGRLGLPGMAGAADIASA